MGSEKDQLEMELPPSVTSCWKKMAAEGGFLANFKDNLSEFVNTSMDQHKICLKKTIEEVGDYVKLSKPGSLLRSSKVAAESGSGSEEVESPPPSETTASQ